jgi:hypothetical protein
MKIHVSTDIPSLTTLDVCSLPQYAHCYYNQTQQQFGSGNNKQDFEPLHPSLAKSMLQKAVRRKMTRKAIKLGNKLAQSSVQELFRRVPIICLEDSMLHPGYPILVWLMMAHSKGYKPPLALILVCLCITADIAGSEYRDYLPPSSELSTDRYYRDAFANLNPTPQCLDSSQLRPAPPLPSSSPSLSPPLSSSSTLTSPEPTQREARCSSYRSERHDTSTEHGADDDDYSLAKVYPSSRQLRRNER